MPQKKQNAFMVFVSEWKSQSAPRLSIQEAIARASPIWKDMPEDKKKIYKDKARNGTQLPNSNKRGKLTCDGTPIEFIEKQQREAQQQLDNMYKTIKDTINNALNTNNLLSQRFYFIMCNHFVRVFQSNEYVPAEVALVEFSLKTGIKSKLHAFVNPKMEFYGNVYEAKHHADTTHQLPLPPDAFGDKSLDEIFLDILEFISHKDNNKNVLPPLYTHENYMPIVKSCLKFLGKHHEPAMANKLNVYSIHQLFYDLKCATSEYGGCDKAPKNKFITDAVLDRDIFEYETNIACNYHEEIDRAHYCALSQVIRWSFTFADYMGKDVNLTFIPGKHMPERFNAEQINSFKWQETSKTDTSSIESACDAISELSLESDYKTCDEITSLRSHNTSLKPQNSQRNTSILAMSDIASTSNRWKRHDTSEAPDSRFFDIDYEEPQLRLNTRRSYGRGIAILDDDFPSLGAKGRGRGKVSRN